MTKATKIHFPYTLFFKDVKNKNEKCIKVAKKYFLKIKLLSLHCFYPFRSPKRTKLG